MGGDISYRAMSSVPVTAMWIPAIVQCGGIHVPTTVLCGGYTCANDCAMWGVYMYQRLCYVGVSTTVLYGDTNNNHCHVGGGYSLPVFGPPLPALVSASPPPRHVSSPLHHAHDVPQAQHV